ncbi:MAG: ABC transporter substrate-binding protein [Deinococcota bacterium]
MKKAFVLLVLFILGFSYAQETRTVTDDLGRTVEVPVNPQRIISTADLTISMALADFGVPFVGSAARLRPDGSLFLRHTETIYGVTFAGDGIVPVVTGGQFDFEAMVALEPDLILAVDSQVEFEDQFETMAPVYFVAEVPTPFAVQQSIARALGLEAEFEERRAIYEAEVTALREALDIPEGTTWSLLTPFEDRIRVANGNFNFTQVLDDLGLVPNELTQEQIDRGVVWSEWYSVEALERMDADIVFMHYSTPAGFPPNTLIERMDAVLPNWCDFITACAEGNVLLIPGSSINAPTFDSLNATLDVVGSHLSSRMVGRE